MLRSCADQHSRAAQIRVRQEPALLAKAAAEFHREPENGAIAGLALNADGTAHHLGEILGDGEAEPGAAVSAGRGGVGLLEALEQTRPLLLRQANAAVADSDVERDLAIG